MVGLDPGAILAAEVHVADRSDRATLPGVLDAGTASVAAVGAETRRGFVGGMSAPLPLATAGGDVLVKPTAATDTGAAKLAAGSEPEPDRHRAPSTPC